MNQTTNYNTLEELIDLNNVNNIVNYVISGNCFEFEKPYIDKLSEFENIYNKLFLDKKKKFYTNNSIHIESKFRNKTSNWMIERLLEIDLEDSINKYGFLNIINIHNKKFNLLKF